MFFTNFINSSHNLACLIVSKSILDHVGTSVNSIESIYIDIIDEEQHQTFIVKELLKSLQAEFVKIVVNVNHIDFGKGMLFQKLEHLLWMDETAKVEDKIHFGNLEVLSFFSQICGNVALKSISEPIGLKSLPSLQVNLVELLGVVLSEIANQVLVDHFVSDVR